MNSSAIFFAGLISLLTVSAYASLRFSMLDPQMPEARSRWIDSSTALGASLALLASTLPAIGQWKQFFAFLAVSLVMTPAILPPYRLTKREEPSWIVRQVRAKVVAQIGKLPKSLFLLLIGVVPDFVLSLFSGPKPPTWFVVLGAAASISILTRPFSLRLPSGKAMPIERASPHLAHVYRVQRFIAVGATLLWLALALPLLEPAHSEEFDLVTFLLALAIALLLS